MKIIPENVVNYHFDAPIVAIGLSEDDNETKTPLCETIYSGELNEVFFFGEKNTKWLVKNGDLFCCKATKGRKYKFVFRVFCVDATEEKRNKFVENVVSGKISKDDIRALTQPLGEYVMP